MMTPALKMEMPQHAQMVQVVTTDNRGLTPEELAVMCVNKLIYVSDGAPPEIREQALAFRKHIEHVVLLYLKQAVHSDRTNVYNTLNDAGYPDLADLIRRL